MELRWTKKAQHDLARVGDRKLQERLVQATARLASTGVGDVRKLQGIKDEYRLRVGKWRIRFMQADGIITVIRVLPRGGAYT